MIINNTELIKSLLSFEDNNDFYFIQIVKRRKENPNMSNGSQTLKNFYVNSLEYYDKMLPLIISFCDNENARAYIRLNRRNYENLSQKMLFCSIKYIMNKNFKSLPNAFDSVSGDFHNDPIKKWLIDVDNDDIEMGAHYVTDSNGEVKMVYGESNLSKLCADVMKLQLQTKNEPMLQFIPTKNGMHIITRPFNLQVFRKIYFKIAVHKDATTLLYCP
jgi:hypothetical protein